MSNEYTHRSFAKALPALIMAAAAAVAGAQSATAQTYCKIETVRTMSSVSDLCGCDIVTPGMLKHILGRSDFSRILEQTSQECPRLARALTDFPVASFTPPPNESDGGGDRDRSVRTENGPNDSVTPDERETEEPDERETETDARPK